MSRLYARFSLTVILVSVIVALTIMDRFLLVARAAKALPVACGGRSTSATARNAMASFTIARSSCAYRAVSSCTTLMAHRPFFLCSRGVGAGGGREEETLVVQPFAVNALNTRGVRQGYVCVRDRDPTGSVF